MAIGFIGKGLSSVWQWTQKAVSSALDKAESFTEAITGGLVVRQETWEQAFDLAEQQKEIWGKIKDIPSTYTVKSEFGVQSEFDWRQKHVMTMQITATDLETGELTERWITIENDEQLTREEWNNLATESFGDAETGGYLDIHSITEYEYYIKG